MKKKLVVGITSYTSVTLLEGQLKYFKDKGFKTFLMAPAHERVDKFCEDEDCIHLKVDTEREISVISDVIALYQIIKHFIHVRPDIINVGTSKMGLLGIIAGKLLGIKYRIYTSRGIRFETEKGTKRLILKGVLIIIGLFAHKIIAISQSVKDKTVKYGVFKEEKVFVINQGSSNGINLSKFNKSSLSSFDIVSLKDKLHINGFFVFGFIGRINDRKGINELYEAFTKLYETEQSVKLIVVGRLENAQIKDKTLINKLNQHPGIIMTGFQKDVPLYLSVMDIFVMPTWAEGFGNVYIQAAAMGVPIIGTNVTGVKDAVKNNYNGILVPAKSPEELYLGMKKLYEDKELRIQFSKNGIDWAKNFDNSIIWDGMYQIYEHH